MVITPMVERAVEIPHTQQELRGLLSELWHNPLVDDKTRNHRSQAGLKFQSMLEHIVDKYPEEFDPTKFVGGRLMGDVWYAGADSDHDVQLYCADSYMTSQFHERYILDKSRNNYLRSQFEIDVLGVQSISNFADCLTLIKYGHIISLLVTPDEHILGNLDLAQQARLNIVQQFSKSTGEAKRVFWDNRFSKLKQYFRDYYRDWGFNPIGRVRRDNKKAEFEERLINRARESEDPNEFISKFLQWLEYFEFPDFNLYHDAIIESGGKLSLTSQNESGLVLAV